MDTNVQSHLFDLFEICKSVESVEDKVEED